MNILAVIPARGGSKRIPGKNIRLLKGKPLIVWTIDAAKDAPEICDILVSTDDPAIAQVATQAGALVPWLRPPELATDTARTADVVIHALDWYEKERKCAVDGVLLLQPTSPFRTTRTVRNGIAEFESHRRPVLGVSPADVHPMWTFTIEGDRLAPFMKDNGLETRSQDLPPCYAVNGCFYLISPADLRLRRSFVAPDAMPLLIDSPRECLDIDTEWDWQVAECCSERIV